MKGRDRHLKRLLKLHEGARAAAKRVLYVGADMVRAEAFRSISAGSISGAGHIPSAPGEAPNRDTGHLQSQLETDFPSDLVATVTSNAEYAAALEFGVTIKHPGGTPYFVGKDGKAIFVSNSGYGAHHTLPTTKAHNITIEPRPYMRPARDKEKPRIRKLFAQEIDKLVKGS